MKFLERFRDNLATPSSDDAHLYEAISIELQKGYRREGLWAIAMTQAEFNEPKAKANYMRMAVKKLKEEIAADEPRKLAAMESAHSLWNARRYSEAAEGLFLLVGRENDSVAATCLGWMSWYGEGIERDKKFALDMFDLAEQTTDAESHCFLGSYLESVDWRRAAENYKYAVQKGDRDAKVRLKNLTKKLKKEGVVPKGFFSRI